MPKPFVWIALVLAACGGSEEVGPDAAIDPPDADTSAPFIGEVLDCGTPAEAGGLNSGTELQRVDLDTTVFPDALCNDGTAAFFYFRPATTVASENRWVIQLQGGGGCGSPDSCAARWCSVDTNFGETQMTNLLSPAEGINGNGILEASGAFAEPNPVGDWNHVYVRYCSSDNWAGQAGPVEVDAVHPVTGDPVTFRIAFSGRMIVDAVLETLRRDGASPPPYTIGGGRGELADLDDATALMLAGGSAGGLGVTNNADRVRARLLADNPGLTQFMGVVDSAFSPSLEALDFSTTTMCLEDGVCDYAALRTVVSEYSIQDAFFDDSCVAWHAANAPETAYACNDEGHVLRNHVASPILIRQGLLDDNVAGHSIDARFSVAGRGLLDMVLFAELVAAEAAALPTGTPEEVPDRAPAIFVPPCNRHETMSDNAAVFGTTLTSGGTAYTMFDTIINSTLGDTPTTLVWAMGDPIDCPP